MAQNLQDAALGSFLGAAIGDAAGATLEFSNEVTARDVELALQMVGGGVWQTAPGQITDDTELALMLAQGLTSEKNSTPSTNSNSKRILDRESIASRYAFWIHSFPFDIGATTRSAFSVVPGKQGYAFAMTSSAKKNCMGSQANGSLMRCTPLAIWGYKLTNDELHYIATCDSTLSHPHPICVSSVTAYIIAISHLLQNFGDKQGAFQRAKQWVESHAHQTVKDWFKDAENDVNVPFTPLIGHVKIAFTHAFRHLKRGTPYKQALLEVLSGGGDSDTNACIVGGLLGAAEGASNLPEDMKQAVLTCDTKKGNPRTPPFSSSQIPDLVTKLLHAAPDSIEISKQEN